jgi:chromosome segregation ATPase
MADTQKRDLLYARLQEVLGDDQAGTLMSYLPASTELATVHDIHGMGSTIETLIGRLDERMDRMEQRIDQLDQRIDQLDQRMDRLDQRMDRLEDRMDRMEQRMDRMEERMDRMEEIMVRFDDRLHGFNEALRDQTRNILLFTLGTMFSLVAGAVALAAIL